MELFSNGLFQSGSEADDALHVGRNDDLRRLAIGGFGERIERLEAKDLLSRVGRIDSLDTVGAGLIHDADGFGFGFGILEFDGFRSFGAEQSGHISTVGYDMYCKLIEEAVREARGEAPAPDELEPRVDLKVNAFLPESYVRGSSQRVEIYKRISGLRSMDDRADIIDELIDRFGDIPESVMNLLDVALVRALCVRLGVDVARRQNGQALLRFDMRYAPNFSALAAALDGSQLRFSASRTPGLILPMSQKQTDEDALRLLAAQLNAAVAALDAQAGNEEKQPD